MNDMLIWIVGIFLAVALIVLWWNWARSGRDVATEAPPEAAEEAPPPPPEITPAAGEPDNLLLIKGLGPKVNGTLNALGIIRFDQFAALSADEAAAVDAQLGPFKGRMARDAWIEQAGLLSRGEIAAFEAKFGKLDSQS